MIAGEGTDTNWNNITPISVKAWITFPFITSWAVDNVTQEPIQYSNAYLHA